jgi:DNA polymerase
MNTLWLDTETYSERPIKDGTYVYAANCEVDIIAHARDDGPVEVIDAANGGDLSEFRYRLKHADIIVAHNAMFDRNVLRLGNLKIETPIEKWRCSMVRAMAHGLPGSLDKLGEIMNIEMDYRKMKRGKELMMLFCKPRPKNSKIRRATKATDPALWAEYLSYAGQDVVATRAICAKLPQWNYTFDLPGQGRPRDLELAHWHRDQRINDRGFAVDGPLVDAALRAVAQEQARLKHETREATGYDPETGEGLGSTTQRDEMLRYLLEQHGVLLPDMKSATLERRLDDPDLDEGIKELLRIRLQVSSTSTSKYKSLKKGTGVDGRMRGTIQFDGAARTRRAAGRLFQPQNVARGTLGPDLVEVWITILEAGAEDLI